MLAMLAMLSACASPHEVRANFGPQPCVALEAEVAVAGPAFHEVVPSHLLRRLTADQQWRATCAFESDGQRLTHRWHGLRTHKHSVHDTRQAAALTGHRHPCMRSCTACL